ncbi:MerR family transcriptional regulator [Cohnella sp. JJ-181]|uniref:MerR family transcriptional regulator n=1 Tax=Cohnella rhizoplanae TaxID=2974897 RepID=UPI0022FF781E|nr:MerR family transcriptional regulator [Cohnella sp. JJ-181]CAI6086628.1 HTH-type transcriptional repressor CarA [Cohnella sp. JJ-181]
MYSIQKVADMLGIPGVTLRAWETRHRIVSPLRSAGGHRLYSEEDVATLRWVKRSMDEQGMKIGELAQMLKQQKASAAPAFSSANATAFFSANAAALSSARNMTAQPALNETYIAERLYPALVGFHTDEANRTIDLALSLYGYEKTFHAILAPLLVRIGTDWESGKIAVAQEHFASQLVLQRFLQVFRSLPVDPRLPSALAFCPPGEHHHLGLLLFSLFLRKKGVDVIYLGPDTPYEGLCQTIEAKNVRAAAISLTDPRHAEALSVWLEQAIARHPALRVLLGGAGFGPPAGGRRQWDGVYYEDSVDWETWFRLTFDSGQ